MAEILSQNDKRSALEREMSELRSKLLIAENEISQVEASEKVSKSLEFELQRAKEEINKLSKERDELLETVSSLHQKMREIDNSGGLTRLTADQEKQRDEAEDEEERMAKNREAYLNVMLLKAKQEKLKAIKIIVNLLGKDTVQSLLRPTSAGLGPSSPSMATASPATTRKSIGSPSHSHSIYSPPNTNTITVSSNSNSNGRARSPTRTNSLYAEELMNADSGPLGSPAAMNNTTIGNDLLDRLITALSSPRAKSQTQTRARSRSARYSLK